ncbi:glycosyltransferase [Solilutibacter silvestris]|uniref:glycosyltransferase n=1 Tax=Solilutibacter silvestris TaxID=1645665 RepID=UPI003D32CAD5
MFALSGALLVVVGVTLYLLGAFFGAIRAVLFAHVIDKAWIEWLLWYSALPIVAGILLFLFDIRTVHGKRGKKSLLDAPVNDEKFTVALTAYNDELSIAEAVRDFQAHPNVQRVIVVSNNSSDRTEAFAREAGAIVFNETVQGYGACVRRAITEAAAYDDTEMIALCEGDMTFRAYDLDKMRPYLNHSDIVNGTRIVEGLQENATQLTTFMHYGNLAVAKLLELKYFGDATLTDVGTTYKIFRTESARRLLPKLTVPINLEFNPYLMETAISNGMKFIEVPITFHPRIGVSKGGNISNRVAIGVGLRMIKGIVTGWRAP